MCYIGSIEDAFRLDIRQLRRHGWLVDGECRTGEFPLTLGSHLTKTEWATVTCDLRDPVDRHVEIKWEGRCQRISILGRAMPFGGMRFFFHCPLLRRPCEVIVFGPFGFGCPAGNRLNYRSQTATKYQRMLLAQRKLERKIQPETGSRHAVRGAKRDRIMWRLARLDRAIDAIKEGRGEVLRNPLRGIK